MSPQTLVYCNSSAQRELEALIKQESPDLDRSQMIAVITSEVRSALAANLQHADFR